MDAPTPEPSAEVPFIPENPDGYETSWPTRLTALDRHSVRKYTCEVDTESSKRQYLVFEAGLQCDVFPEEAWRILGSFPYIWATMVTNNNVKVIPARDSQSFFELGSKVVADGVIPELFLTMIPNLITITGKLSPYVPNLLGVRDFIQNRKLVGVSATVTRVQPLTLAQPGRLHMSMVSGGTSPERGIEAELEAEVQRRNGQSLLVWRQAYPTDNWRSMLGAKGMHDYEVAEVYHILSMWALKLNCGLEVEGDPERSVQP